MSINKNDCLDCANCVNVGKINQHKWICEKGYEINQNENGLLDVLDHDCLDFKYEE